MVFSSQDAIIGQQTVNSIRMVFAPKVDGAATLAKATVTAPIGRIVHFGSLVALIGNAGQANYAAANEALNTNAALQQSSGIPTVSIMWGPWAVGMAASNSRITARFEQAGLEAISPAKGLQALVEVISSRHSSLIAAPIHWPRFMAASSAAAGAPIFANFRSAVTLAVPHVIPSVQLEIKGNNVSISSRKWSGTDVQRQVVELVVSMLGPGISVDQPLMEAGLDSLSGEELRNRLSDAFGMVLPATVTFDYPTILTLAGFIDKRINVEIFDPLPPAATVKVVSSMVATEAAISADLRETIRAMLGVAVSGDQPLMEAGLDSLSAVELRNVLGGKYGMELPATVIYDFPSINALAGFIAKSSSPASHEAPLSLDTFVGSITPSCIPASSLLTTTDVVGTSDRYPGPSTDASSFWETATYGADLQQRIPIDRWDIESHYAVDIVPGTVAINAPFGAFCNNVGDFDAAVFGISPMEAVTIDPQQRLLIEESQRALVDAAPHMTPNTGSHTGKHHVLVMKFMHSLPILIYIYIGE